MKRILVGYATRAGTTAEVAVVIAGQLRYDGYWVECLPINEIKTIKGYDAVVIGSPIRMGSWTPEAVSFVMRFYERLLERPVAIFTTCMSLTEDTPAAREQVMRYLNPVRVVLNPQAEGYFAGALTYDRLPLPARLAAHLTDKPEGDYRDWAAIREWAHSLTPLFEGRVQPATV
jgi:menaquinone-dependent protoporphyrinogen oxidase